MLERIRKELIGALKADDELAAAQRGGAGAKFSGERRGGTEEHAPPSGEAAANRRCGAV